MNEEAKLEGGVGCVVKHGQSAIQLFPFLERNQSMLTGQLHTVAQKAGSALYSLPATIAILIYAINFLFLHMSDVAFPTRVGRLMWSGSLRR